MWDREQEVAGWFKEHWPRISACGPGRKGCGERGKVVGRRDVGCWVHAERSGSGVRASRPVERGWAEWEAGSRPVLRGAGLQCWER